MKRQSVAEEQQCVHMPSLVDEEVHGHEGKQTVVLIVSHRAHFHSSGVLLGCTPAELAAA